MGLGEVWRGVGVRGRCFYEGLIVTEIFKVSYHSKRGKHGLTSSVFPLPRRE